MTVTLGMINLAQLKGADDDLNLPHRKDTAIFRKGQSAQEPELDTMTHWSAEITPKRESLLSLVTNPMAFASSLEPQIRLSIYKWNAIEQYLTLLLAGALDNHSAQISGILWIQDRCIVRADRGAGGRQCLHPEVDDTPTTLKRNGLRGDQSRVRVSSAAVEYPEDSL